MRWFWIQRQHCPASYQRQTVAKAKTPPAPLGDVVIADGEELNLRNRHMAAVLAWLVPGAGHFYQRRYFKSAVFSICVFSTFLIGMFVGGGRCVYASWNGTERRWQYVLQAGIGLPAMPAAMQAWRARNNNPELWGGFMSAPKSQGDLDRWHGETASGFDMGTLYTMIAGLLNVLVVFDAYAGPLPPPPPKKKQTKLKEEEDDSPEPDDQEKKPPAETKVVAQESEQEPASKKSTSAKRRSSKKRGK